MNGSFMMFFIEYIINFKYKFMRSESKLLEIKIEKLTLLIR